MQNGTLPKRGRLFKIAQFWKNGFVSATPLIQREFNPFSV